MRARKDSFAALTRERKLEDDLGLDTNETTLLDVASVGAALLLFDIQEGFLPLDFFVVGVGFGCGGDFVLLLPAVALLSAISLRIQSSNLEMNELIDSIPCWPWSCSSCTFDCSSVRVSWR